MNSFTGSPDKALKRFAFTHSGQKDHCILHKTITFPQTERQPSLKEKYNTVSNIMAELPLTKDCVCVLQTYYQHLRKMSFLHRF